MDVSDDTRDIFRHEMQNKQRQIYWQKFKISDAFSQMEMHVIPDTSYQLEENVEIPDISYNSSLGESDIIWHVL